jgi:hypothetical protein
MQVIFNISGTHTYVVAFLFILGQYELTFNVQLAPRLAQKQAGQIYAVEQGKISL